jgi:hypothetical protein
MHAALKQNLTLPVGRKSNSNIVLGSFLKARAGDCLFGACAISPRYFVARADA